MSPHISARHKVLRESSHFGGARYSVLVISEVLHLHEKFQLRVCVCVWGGGVVIMCLSTEYTLNLWIFGSIFLRTWSSFALRIVSHIRSVKTSNMKNHSITSNHRKTGVNRV